MSLSEKNVILPAIIKDWLGKLKDPSVDFQTKETYSMNLDFVSRTINRELEEYRLVKNRIEKKR